MEHAPDRVFEERESLPDISDLEEAKEAIVRAMERGDLPLISVPEEYIDAARVGIQAHTTWVGEKIVAGTILRAPYSPENENRHFFRINVSPEQLEPRFTGPDNHFHGVVVFRGPIPPGAMQEVVL